MYISPDTQLHILSNCPINSDYEHTLYFDNAENQFNYFNSLTKHYVAKMSFSRLSDGYLRVNIPIAQLYDCNYLIFQNSAFTNKWFYAFIKGVEYVSNTVSEIMYSVDVMQSWFFDYTLRPCLIDREHTATDVIGENIIPEPVKVGEYETTAISKFEITANNSVCVIMTSEFFIDVVAEYVITPQKWGGTILSCWVYIVGQHEVDGFLSQVNTKGYADKIISISLLPISLLPNSSELKINTLIGATKTTTITPKNKKLYTSPYTELIAYSNGNAKNFKYEQFSGVPSFTIRTSFGADLPTVMTPTNYESEQDNIKYQLTISGFPLLPYIRDYYQTWLAYNKANNTSAKSSALLSGIGGVASGLANMSVGSAINGVVSGIDKAVNVWASYETAKVMPDEMQGSANGFDVNFISGFSGFYTYCRSAKAEYAQMVDDFFTMYGYACKQLKVPNRNVRPHWCYTKTVNCIIKGKINQNDITKIERIYDKGITFWKNGNDVGDYSLDNSV